MMPQTYTDADIDALVQTFIQNAQDQESAMLEFDTKRLNMLILKMRDIKESLGAMPGDRRNALLPLLQHRNHQVRLRAAMATLTIAPEAARATLEGLARVQHTPQAADARHCLMGIDEGWFKPS